MSACPKFGGGGGGGWPGGGGLAVVELGAKSRVSMNHYDNM